ncbi:hypothetical protein DL762_009992 [Monosporascus cannonballus]|uniref:Heterokaryon incompatibility domain-containing protein n=1 Tax=Monosporascus cannonballus TaxID=155416 RepID=A0ABY0GV07_9PEZI|nr:hypothetical protein DL762_009992 [Monosporascus cannonballus]RYP01045.1 hypothetical protein DL763_000466 [Monosporascus cannonballus]
MLPTVLNATLESFDLEDALPYEAVSYCWGDPTPSEQMMIDGCVFGLTQSAYKLLLARRSFWRPRWIWIDAICINQQDEVEKSTQVRLMQEIYKKANQVVVFPGGGVVQARLASIMLYEVFAAQKTYEGTGVDFNKFFFADRQSPRWHAFSELFRSPYFDRVWVIQEVAVGKEVLLYHGGRYIPWCIFIEVASACLDHHRRNLLLHTDTPGMRSFVDKSAFENIAVMSLLRNDWDIVEAANSGRSGEPDHFKLGAILFNTANFKSTDPRDKIFALLGLATGAYDRQLIPDYRKTPSQVYTEVSQRLIVEEGTTALFSLAGIGFNHPRKVQSLPSWIPDFSEQRPNFPLAEMASPQKSYHASKMTKPHVRIANDSDGRAICVNGILVDEVVCVCSTRALNYDLWPGERYKVLDMARAKHEWIKQAESRVSSLLGESRNRVDGRSQFDQFWYTLVAKRISGSSKDPEEYYDLYKSWRQLLRAVAVVGQNTAYEDVGADIIRGTDPKVIEDIDNGSITSFDINFSEVCVGRLVAVTGAGRLCLVPPLTREGDVVFIPFGAQVPYAFRRADRSLASTDAYELVGEAYVHGIMHGEAIDNATETEIELV